MNKYIFIALLLSTTAANAQEPPPSLEQIMMTLAPPAPNTGTRDIYIKGEIEQNMAFSVRDQLRRLNSESAAEITIHITSPGGGVYAGLQIIDDMMEGRSPIRTVCEGYCMSMAATMLASGDVRESTESATIMFHEVSSKVQGKISEMKEDIADMERLQSIMDNIIHDRSGMSFPDIKKMESYDHYMSPKEAKSLNLIDKIRGKHGK